MTAREVIETLNSKGCSIRKAGDELRVRAPKGILTPDMIDTLKVRKQEIIRLLTSHPCTVCGRFAFPEPTTCYFCRPSETAGKNTGAAA